MDVIYNDEDVIAGLQRLLQQTGDIKPALRAIGDALTESTKRRFETTTSSEGVLWAANSDVCPASTILAG